MNETRGYRPTITIKFEARVYGSTASYPIGITARGTTPDDVIADARRQAESRGAVDLRASGVSNTRADWEAMFGPVADERLQFLK